MQSRIDDISCRARRLQPSLSLTTSPTTRTLHRRNGARVVAPLFHGYVAFNKLVRSNANLGFAFLRKNTYTPLRLDQAAFSATHCRGRACENLTRPDGVIACALHVCSPAIVAMTFIAKSTLLSDTEL